MDKKKVVHIYNEYPEHDWKREKDGPIDMWALDVGYHNGPMCQRCYESFCEHCNPDWEQDGPCIEEYYKCPGCGEKLSSWPKKYNFCPDCGQALDWSDDE